MNLVTRSDIQGSASTVGEAIFAENTSVGDFDLVWPVLRSPRSYHSGLPLVWREGWPSAVTFSSQRTTQLVLKRAFDVLAAALALAALFPLFVAVALAIKVSSPGPVFFRQVREGLNGELFVVFKFRSMKIDECDDSGVTQTRSNDPRVTWVGRLLRKTSIDELPQLLNVLWGNMSLVGPRPHVPGMMAGGKAYRDLVPYYQARLDMRPGITGWAQAKGLRGSTSDAERATSRIDHDIAYIQNFSIWLDMKILVETIRREFLRGSGD